MCLGEIGQVTRRWDEGGLPMAMIRSGDKESAANLLYVPDVSVGDDVLVQFGFVLERLEPERAEAARSIRASLASQEGSED